MASKFWAGVDLAIALPISWVPLTPTCPLRPLGLVDLLGTAVGYLLAQVWFFALGVLFLLSIGQGDVIAALLAVLVGLLAMAVLVVDETDEVFANLYSAGVSLEERRPPPARPPGRRRPGRRRHHLAAVLVDDLARYENFLFPLGALFVPLFGCWRPTGTCWPAAATTSRPCTGPTAPTGASAGGAGLVASSWSNRDQPGDGDGLSLVEGLFADLLGLPFPGSAWPALARRLDPRPSRSPSGYAGRHRRPGRRSHDTCVRGDADQGPAFLEDLEERNTKEFFDANKVRVQGAGPGAIRRPGGGRGPGCAAASPASASPRCSGSTGTCASARTRPPTRPR